MEVLSPGLPSCDEFPGDSSGEHPVSSKPLECELARECCVVTSTSEVGEMVVLLICGGRGALRFGLMGFWVKDGDEPGALECLFVGRWGCDRVLEDSEARGYPVCEPLAWSL